MDTPRFIVLLSAAVLASSAAGLAQQSLVAHGSQDVYLTGNPQITSQPRYADQGDGTVVDSRTGLIWLRNADCWGKMSRQDALQAVARLASGECGLTDGSESGDWRLPTRDEWEAMTEPRCNPPISDDNGTGCSSDQSSFAGIQSEYMAGEGTAVQDQPVVHSFALYPELHQPSGSTNLSQGESERSALVHVWPVRARSAKSGMGGLAYSN